MEFILGKYTFTPRTTYTWYGRIITDGQLARYLCKMASVDSMGRSDIDRIGYHWYPNICNNSLDREVAYV